MDSSANKGPKAGIARSILQRVNSKNDVRTSDKFAPETSSPLSQTMSQQSLPIPAGPNIENSVRIFRLFEALRSGDTSTISKVIKDSSSVGVEEDSRHSSASAGSSGGALEGTSILHLAIQCADVPIVEYVLSNSVGTIDINARDKDGNTPLHIAAMLNRAPVVRVLLEQKGINDSVANYQGRTPLDLAKNPEVFQQLQLARSMYIDSHVRDIQRLVTAGDYDGIERLLSDAHFQRVIDVNGGELSTDPSTTENGGTLLHEAAKKRDAKLIEILLLNGADPFRRDRKGKLPQDVTKDDRIRALLKKSPAAAAAQRGIQEKSILGSGGPQAAVGPPTGENALGGREGREMKGFLKKWVNYTTGYKLRWFVLEDGVLSYYKHQDDAGSACRGAINMRIAQLHMDAQDKLRFEIIGKSSVKYHLKANHQVEAKRWFWALNNAIQYSKDEAKARARSEDQNAERLRHAKAIELERKQTRDVDTGNATASRATEKPYGGTVGMTRTSTQMSREMHDDEDGTMSTYDPSLAGEDQARKHRMTADGGDPGEDEDFGDDASSVEAHPVSKDAFLITAHSARLQLDLLAQISTALKSEKSRKPEASISEPNIAQALSSYEAAVANLNALVGDLGRIARDREAFWQYRLEQEVNVRRIWEDNMMKVAKDQEELENRIGESEEKRKRTKRALRDALEIQGGPTTVEEEATSGDVLVEPIPSPPLLSNKTRTVSTGRRKSTYAEMADIAASESEDEDDEEFFDAVGAGEVEVVEALPPPRVIPQSATRETVHLPAATEPRQEQPRHQEETVPPNKASSLQTSYRGYEDPVRKKLAMDDDNRPKISLWGILKSMIGKDMTKMTLPVSFNEPTSLLQRVAEDMEYTELLDTAASRADSTERLVYVAAFAASEYSSTIGRVAKPFNPMLGETYEYARPDKGYRFFSEQVSHHPPVGAAWAEASNWTYYGESAVKSKFYGKSFDINPLGTWFLKLQPQSGGREEMYTWKKVTTSVVGIITGNPTVDNYGPMEVRNHTTGDVCLLDFKQRGWKSSSAYQVTGKVVGRDGNTRWSIGGRWNDKIYARLTPGYEDALEGGAKSKDSNPNKAFLVWESHARPTGIPFSLTPFVVTMNALPSSLRQHLPRTDTRLRPDQRAMEDGAYDLAATEKNRVEEKQRAARKAREQTGEEHIPQWFKRGKCSITGEEFWVAKGSEEDQQGAGGVEYWVSREKGEWNRCEDIF